MQDITSTQPKKVRLSEMSFEDRQKLVGAFAWLIQEDKKQNPALYQIKKIKTYD